MDPVSGWRCGTGQFLRILAFVHVCFIAAASVAASQWYLITPRAIPNRDGSVSVDPGGRRSEWRTVGGFGSAEACEQARHEIVAEASERLRVLRSGRVPVNVAGIGRVLVNEDVLNYLPQTFAECVEAGSPR